MVFGIEPIEALKWVAFIFIIGFIGYFGKYLSKLVLGRIHKSGPEGKKQPAQTQRKTKEEMEYDLEKKRLKLDKKRIKAGKKAGK